jgi:hypothetical protein
MKLKNDFLIREFNGTVYAVQTDLQSDKKSDPIVLNETGRILWTALQNGADTAGLVTALLSEYDIDIKTAEDDTAAFVRKLRDAGLLAEEK